MKNTLLSLLITVICFSCSGQNGISKDEKVQIQEVIENHDKTLIYIWSESCGASKNMLERNIKPYLEGLEKNNVGIVIIYYGKEEAVADLKADNRLIISSNLSALFGKMNANKTVFVDKNWDRKSVEHFVVFQDFLHGFVSIHFTK